MRWTKLRTSRDPLLASSALAKHLKQTSWQKGCPQHGLLRVQRQGRRRRPRRRPGARDERIYPTEAKAVARDALAAAPRKRGSACGRACKALFLITLVAAAAFSGAAAAGSFDSFCLGAAPLPKRGSSRAPMVESRAEAAVGLGAGEAFCSAVDLGRTAVGIGRTGLGYLPPLPAFITRRVPAPVRALWDWVAGGEEPRARQGRATTEAEAGSEAGRSAGPGREACRKTSRKEASADLKTSRVVRRGRAQRAAGRERGRATGS